METSNAIFLQLGDIIQIHAPSNSELDNIISIINYIDNRKITLIQINDGSITVLNINENGNLSDESITSIDILSRADNNSYAKQHKLLPGIFIDVHIGGDIPLTITGEITNLEEDMIEIKIYDTDELIYIDFGYKGIPEDIPIKQIVIREPPKSKTDITYTDEDVAKTSTFVDKSIINDDIIMDEEVSLQIPVENIKQQLHDILLDADQIVFKGSLESITQTREIPDERKRYGIETQVNDMLDELLSYIPNANRTSRVINKIHTEIERFKQLRDKFSVFDANGNANMPEYKGADHKPLVSHLQSLNYKLNWILPIVKNYKKIYDIDVGEDTQIPDILSLTLANTRIEEYDIRELYKTNTNDFQTYMNKLNPYLTPFQNDYKNTYLTTQEVQQHITAIVDNLEDFYSSVVNKDNIKRKRFLISKYNLGLNKLKSLKLTYSGMKSKILPMTENDTMSVKSFMTLPTATMIFSNINLPNTSIIDRSNYNLKYLNYWQLLRDNTIVATIDIDNLNSSIEFDEHNYLKHATQFILSDDNDDPDKYNKYLNIITPKTRVLFKLIKKYLNNNLSFVSVVKYLQPFMIYVDDISFKQYEDIIEFIETRIREYRKSFIDRKTQFSKLSQKTTNNFVYESLLYKILKGRQDLGDAVLESYGFNVNQSYKYKGNLDETTVLSENEIITKMMNIDYTTFYNTSISSLNKDLLTTFDFEELLNQKQDEFNKNIEKEKASNECKTYVLAKRYIDLDELNADNGIPVYFDKKYDTTVYDIIKEYDTEQSQMDPVAFKTFLIEQLVQNIGLNKPDARYEAISMIEGKRQILDGQYAVLEIDNIDTIQYYYYKREDDQWVRDENIPTTSFFGTNNLFCNIQDKCIKIDNTCADETLGNDLVKKRLIKNMYDEFDFEYQESLDKYKKKLSTKFKLQYEKIDKLKRINRYILYKYELAHLTMSNGITENDDTIISPYLKSLDAIIRQSDIIKKNHDIVKFVKLYTRTYIPGQDIEQPPHGSGPFWLYCVDTSTRLLPTFVEKLASIFVLNGNYTEVINEIKTQQGVIVDDQIVDKYSGWNIEKIALNTDESYDPMSGFKLQSREIMEMDYGTALLQSATLDYKKEIVELLMNPTGKMINNIITTISNYIGISIDSVRTHVIKHTLIALDTTVDTQEVYEAKAARYVKEGKKKPKTYEEVFYKALLIYTLSYMCIFIQTAIPSIQSKKTFTGCKKSFQGYPNEENLSNIEYIACVAAGIKSSVQPWKTISKKQSNIVSDIKKTIDTFILKDSKILALIEQKRIYLLQNEDVLIPIELDVNKWNTFLPPLQNIDNKTPTNLPSDFNNSFAENIKTGSKIQHVQYRIIQSKSIYFSMAIIQAIQRVVEKEQMLLTNNNSIPFMQNACCNTDNYKTIEYFINKDNNILIYNNAVSYQQNMIFDVKNTNVTTMLVDPTNTKIVFPSLSNEFSEDSIYRAFIEYCNFNNDIPINNNLLDICVTKPDTYDKLASLSDNITALKKENNIYSIETFNKLIDEVNKMNVIPLDLVYKYTSNIHQLRELVQYMLEYNNPIGDEFLKLFKNILDTFDIIETDNSDVINFKKYIINTINNYRSDIHAFINKFSRESKHDQETLKKCISNIMTFSTTNNNYFMKDEDTSAYNSINFAKNAIHEFINVFPNIIKNKVNYDSIKIHSHWNLSQFHNSDIKMLIKDIYNPLKQFYGNDIIIPYLTKIQYDLQDFIKMVDLTYLYADIIQLNGDNIKSILDNKTVLLIFEFYFLYMIHSLIQLTNDTTFVSGVNIPPNDTTTELEEENTFVDFPDVDIVAAFAKSNQKEAKTHVANLISTLIQMICKSKDKINYNSQEIKNKITRAKDKERQQITSSLGDMTKEHREVENIFKNLRLERWNKGLQKGLTQYVSKTYDEERAQREKDDILEKSLILAQATLANRDIDIFEAQEREITEERIEQDIYSLSGIPEDDDYGEDVDDSYALQFDDHEE